MLRATGAALLCCGLLAGGARGEDTRSVPVPGLDDMRIALPQAWSAVAEPPPGAVLMIHGPFEPSTTADDLAPRPVLALNAVELKPGQSIDDLALAATTNAQRMLADFALDTSGDIHRYLGGRRWSRLRFAFTMAQEPCEEELWIGVIGGHAIYIACSCVPSRFDAYESTFSEAIASLDASRAGLAPPPGSRRR